MLADEILIIGGAYFVKARAVGGRSELRRQLEQQLRFWSTAFADGNARQVALGAVVLGAQSALEKVRRRPARSPARPR